MISHYFQKMQTCLQISLLVKYSPFLVSLFNMHCKVI